MLACKHAPEEVYRRLCSAPNPPHIRNTGLQRGNVLGLQVSVVQRAERNASQAVDVASGLSIAAFNIGIAGGAWGGGLIIAHLGLTALAGRLDRQEGLHPHSGPAHAVVAL